MPYVAQEDRKKLNPTIENVAIAIAKRVKSADTPAELSVFYKRAFMSIAETIYRLVSGKQVELKTDEQKLGGKIYELDREYNYDAAFNGELNYSITRIIQLTPREMVQRGISKQELRYWIYSQTVGALMRVQDEVKALATKANDPARDWVFDGLVGVFEDIKDEYKRRVNPDYELEQILKSGDCYDGPYHTTLREIRDDAGNVIGWHEIMPNRESPKNKDKTIS